LIFFTYCRFTFFANVTIIRFLKSGIFPVVYMFLIRQYKVCFVSSTSACNNSAGMLSTPYALAGGTPGGGQAKRPKQTGQLSYARAAQEGIRVAIICEDYPRGHISRDNFADIKRAISQLVDGLPEEGFTPRLVDSYWSKGAAIMVCQDTETRGWLESKAPTMAAWEGSRLKVVGLDALPTYKRVVAWFPGPVEDTERLLLRLSKLNRGLDTGNWRVYKRKEELNGVRLVLSIDTASVCSVQEENKKLTVGLYLRFWKF